LLVQMSAPVTESLIQIPLVVASCTTMVVLPVVSVAAAGASVVPRGSHSSHSRRRLAAASSGRAYYPVPRTITMIAPLGPTEAAGPTG
jgi:hypothetical protein